MIRWARFSRPENLSKNARARAFFCVVLAFSLCLSCQKSEKSTPTWTTTTEKISRDALPKVAPLPPLPWRFITWNAQNWRINAEGNTSKSPESKAAAISLLAREKPDVLGLCEIGSLEDLQEIQQLLAAQGLPLPHAHFSETGVDNQRHLAILSRFPLTIHQPAFPLQWKNGSHTERMRRGICDVSIEIENQPIRLLGVHLKSKFEGLSHTPTEEIRLAETQLLRRHIQEILTTQPQTPLLVYGDFNDTPRSATIHLMRAAHPWLTALNPADSRGETWTQHWEEDDLYSRLDWIWITKNLRTRVEESKILDEQPYANAASDHRAILISFD